MFHCILRMIGHFTVTITMAEAMTSDGEHLPSHPLPPEIIYEILEHCLFVSPETLFSAPALFWGYRDYNPGGRPMLRRSAHLLRVCRQWYAIALPLLYAALWILLPSE